MRLNRYVVSVTALTTVLACNPFASHHKVGQIDPAHADATMATVSISNAPPKGVHPWHLYRGQCGEEGTPVGTGNTYPLLKVGSDGKATVSTTLPFALPSSGSYYVVVNASETNMGTVLACGNLAP